MPSLRTVLGPPVEMGKAYAWSLADITSARDQQMRGNFARPAALAAAMRTNASISVARATRLAPQRCIKVEIIAAPGARGQGPRNEAEPLYGDGGIAISDGTRADINGCLVDHGVAFAHNTWNPREDGTRTDVEVRYWPIEHVRWDSFRRVFVTRVDGAAEVDIVHGDGRWIVIAEHDFEPFNQSAALLPASLVWAANAFANRDWSKGSVAHGSAKVVGKLPEGVALQDANGLTPMAVAFAALLRELGSSDSPVGIAPAGSSIDFLTNNSTAWQVWDALVKNTEKLAARIYLGTDGVLGSNGGAPGVDISQLLGVASTKVQGDLGAISRALKSGSIDIWCALNFGDSSLAPTRRYMLPDADADADRASMKERTDAFFAHVSAAKDGGFVIDQKGVDAIAKLYDVTAHKLPEATEAKVPTIALAQTDLAGVVSVNEARASAGLGPLTTRDGKEDPNGYITVGEYKALKEASAAAPVAPAPAAPLRAVGS